MNTILIPVSIGELADKLSILEIKAARIDDAGKRAHVQVELEGLRTLWDAQVAKSRKVVEGEGVKISEPDKQAFIDAMKPVYDKWVQDPKLKDMVARIQATK